MVRMESSIKRYIGHSSEQKPRPGALLEDGTVITFEDLKVGSSFLEEDTGFISRWTGIVWSEPVVEAAEELEVLNQILAEMRAAREEARIGLPVPTNHL